MIKLKKATGAYSKSQIWQILSIVAHGVTAGALVALGLPIAYIPIANMLIGMIQGLVALRLRTITSEAM